MNKAFLEVDEERFQKALKLAVKDVPLNKIGLLSEHTLHRVIKFYLSLDESFHEIKTSNKFADVLIDNHIYEVQTKNFNLLRSKLEVLLKDYKVSVIFPIFLNAVNYEFNDKGELIKERKSTRHDTFFKIFPELYKIKSYLNHPNLDFIVFSFDIKEIRNQTKVTYKSRKGYERENQIPVKLNDIVNNLFERIKQLNIEDGFTSKDFRKITKLTLSKTQTTLNVLTYLNIVERIGKKQNAFLYKIKK